MIIIHSVCACVRARVHACVHACVCVHGACVCVRGGNFSTDIHQIMPMFDTQSNIHLYTLCITLHIQ